MKLPPTSSSIVAAVRSLGPAALNLSCECTRATFSVARAPEMVSRLFKEAVGQLQKSLRVGGAAENPRSIARERLQAMVAVHRNAAAVSGVNFHALQADMIQCIKRHVQVEDNDVNISVRKDADTGLDMFEIQVEMGGVHVQA